MFRGRAFGFQLKVFFDGGDNHGDQLSKLLVIFSNRAVQLDSAKYMNCCMGMPAGLSGYAKRIFKNDAVEFDARTANFYLNENAKIVWLRFNVLGFKIRSFNLLNWA